MEFNKQSIHDFIGRFKNKMRNGLAGVRSNKLLTFKFPTVLFRKTRSKTKLLREKYSNSHKRIRKSFLPLNLRIQESFKSLPQRFTKLKLVNFSLSQLSAPGKFQKYLNLRTALALVALIAFCGLLVKAASPVNAYAVEADGKRIAVVAEKEAAEKLLSELKAEKTRTWKRKVDVQQQLAFKKVKVKKYQVEDIGDLKKELNDKLTFLAVATGIKINGQVAIVVKDNKTAEDVLCKLKEECSLADIQNATVSFEEKIELVDVPVSLNNLLTEEQALEALKEGEQKKSIHVVKQGDSLWSIARHYNMRVAELQTLNPSLKGERLDLGQELNLVAFEPLVNVILTGERTVKENLPYKVVVQTDKNAWRGKDKVKVQGSNGLKEVTYKIVMKNGDIVNKDVLDEKQLTPAVNKVVVRGSKLVVASRGGGGKVGWPISGKITSGFGRRWGSMHTGIDIDGVTGQPVGAAAAGVVTSAGWEGAYGKMVTVKHDNGLVTRYAHLSKIEVSSGQKVERGDLLGRVGSTGRSTGSHLHFEILSGGSFKNPINFLK